MYTGLRLQGCLHAIAFEIIACIHYGCMKNVAFLCITFAYILQLTWFCEHAHFLVQCLFFGQCLAWMKSFESNSFLHSKCLCPH